MTRKKFLTSLSVVAVLIIFVLIIDSLNQGNHTFTNHAAGISDMKRSPSFALQPEISKNSNLFKFN